MLKVVLQAVLIHSTIVRQFIKTSNDYACNLTQTYLKCLSGFISLYTLYMSLDLRTNYIIEKNCLLSFK